MTNGPTLTGFLTFADRPKADAAAPITELERLGVHHQGGAPHRKGRGISAAGASVFLSVLPVLPSQILLNNLLDNTGQLVIPTDRVDAEAPARPAAWDMRFIRHFMASCRTRGWRNCSASRRCPRLSSCCCSAWS